METEITFDVAHAAYERNGLPTHSVSASVARALLALESRLAEVEGERDALAANGPAIVGALDDLAMARAERDEAVRDYVAVADALGFVDRDDTGRIGAVGVPDLLVDEVREERALLSRIDKAVGEVVHIAESWDCSETWDDDGDCIDNSAHGPCLRCHVILTLTTALALPGAEGREGEGE